MFTFSVKKSTEIQIYSFDFSSQLEANESIVWANVSSEDEMGEDTKSANMIMGSSQIKEGEVSIKVGRGLAGKNYIITCTVQTSLGRTAIIDGLLPIEPKKTTPITKAVSIIGDGLVTCSVDGPDEIYIPEDCDSGLFSVLLDFQDALQEDEKIVSVCANSTVNLGCDEFSPSWVNIGPYLNISDSFAFAVIAVSTNFDRILSSTFKVNLANTMTSDSMSYEFDSFVMGPSVPDFAEELRDSATYLSGYKDADDIDLKSGLQDDYPEEEDNEDESSDTQGGGGDDFEEEDEAEEKKGPIIGEDPDLNMDQDIALISDNTDDSDIDEILNLAKNNKRDTMETKKVSFEQISVKEVTKDGINYGVISGYASTFGNIDRQGDRMVKGAFRSTIQKHGSKSRPVRMYYQHDDKELIGAFNVDSMKEDDKGLFVVGQINLEVQRGREVYALAKQGVLSDMSIGYTVRDFDIKGGVRDLKDVDLWEISVVSEPANTEAVITDVKSVKAATPFKDYPIAPEATIWDDVSAIKRLRKLSGSKESPSTTYKNYFMYYDASNEDTFSGYKLPFCDVIGGKVEVVPKAIYAIAAALNGARGGLSVPAGDKAEIIAHLNKYYAKMGKDSPLKTQMTFTELKTQIKTKRDVERVLRDAGLSRTSASFIASLIDEKKFEATSEQRDAEPTNTKLNSLLKELTDLVRKI